MCMQRIIYHISASCAAWNAYSVKETSVMTELYEGAIKISNYIDSKGIIHYDIF